MTDLRPKLLAVQYVVAFMAYVGATLIQEETALVGLLTVPLIALKLAGSSSGRGSGCCRRYGARWLSGLSSSSVLARTCDWSIGASARNDRATPEQAIAVAPAVITIMNVLS